MPYLTVHRISMRENLFEINERKRIPFFETYTKLVRQSSNNPHSILREHLDAIKRRLSFPISRKPRSHAIAYQSTVETTKRPGQRKKKNRPITISKARSFGYPYDGRHRGSFISASSGRRENSAPGSITKRYRCTGAIPPAGRACTYFTIIVQLPAVSLLCTRRSSPPLCISSNLFAQTSQLAAGINLGSPAAES